VQGATGRTNSRKRDEGKEDADVPRLSVAGWVPLGQAGEESHDRRRQTNDLGPISNTGSHQSSPSYVREIVRVDLPKTPSAASDESHPALHEGHDCCSDQTHDDRQSTHPCG
jgi:hypothetical protein